MGFPLEVRGKRAADSCRFAHRVAGNRDRMADDDDVAIPNDTCTMCGGSGETKDGSECPLCKGTGTIDVSLPDGS
jgi:rubrerythrin